MSDMLGLLPVAISVALLGGATWFLLSREVGAGRWLFAALLFGHGWVHLMFVMPRTDMAKSWLITGVGIDPTMIRGIAVALILAVSLSYGLASLATVGLLVPGAWWPGLVGAGTIASVLLLAVFFTPTFFIGFAIDVVLLCIVLTSTWAPSLSATQGGALR